MIREELLTNEIENAMKKLLLLFSLMMVSKCWTFGQSDTVVADTVCIPLEWAQQAVMDAIGRDICEDNLDTCIVVNFRNQQALLAAEQVIQTKDRIIVRKEETISELEDLNLYQKKEFNKVSLKLERVTGSRNFWMGATGLAGLGVAVLLLLR